MAHSIELLLDSATDAAIRTQWQALADAGLPSQLTVVSPTNRPHVTLVAAPRIGPGVDEALRGLADRLPLGCVVGAALIFGGPKHTLARLIIPSAELLALQAQVYQLTLPHLDATPFPHCRPGHWTPHVTLARRLGEDVIGPTLTVVDGHGELSGRIVGLRRWDSDERVDHQLVG